MNRMSDEFLKTVEKHHPDSLKLEKLSTLQVNLGNLCNQNCRHCHIEAGPAGSSIMAHAVISQIISFLKSRRGLILDLTGGAPEMHPDFIQLVEEAGAVCSEILVRTNLTILMEKGMEQLPAFFKKHKVHLIASLPCYTRDNVDRQRGKDTFDRSITALKLLNKEGYGKELILDLVYNPGSPALPSPQDTLEADYKKQLDDSYGITFNSLFTITNVPIGRYMTDLKKFQKYDSYMSLLKDNFNAGNVENLMCRSLLSIDYQGNVYNCDFNQALDMPLKTITGEKITLSTLGKVQAEGLPILTGDHCYACTAGAGSSCTGQLTD